LQFKLTTYFYKTQIKILSAKVFPPHLQNLTQPSPIRDYPYLGLRPDPGLNSHENDMFCSMFFKLKILSLTVYQAVTPYGEFPERYINR